MFTTRGFLYIFHLARGQGDDVSPIGELSSYSRTFSSNVKRHYSSDYPNFEYYAFHTYEDDNGPSTIDEELKEKILDIGQWLHNKAIDGDIPEEDDQELISLFYEEYGVEDHTVDFIGPRIEDDEGRIYPGFFHFRVEGLGGDSDRVDRVFLWLADDVFQTNYDDYEIKIIPPTDELDDIFERPGHVQEVMETRTRAEYIERIEQLRRQASPTYIRVEEAEFKFPTDLDESYTTYWTFLIYGQAGYNFDNILHELESYIEENSDHPFSEWRELAPDFFYHTEFVIIPFWDQFAVENNNLDAGIYSPIIDFKRAYELTTTFATLESYEAYTDEHIQDHLRLMPTTYKNLPLALIGNPENRDGKIEIEDNFPDYIATSTTSTEFSRMSQNTQDWVIRMQKLLKEAEQADEFNFLPENIFRVYRDGNMFLLTQFDRFRYLVLSRMSYLEQVED